MLPHLQLPRWREKIQAILMSHSHQLSAARHLLSTLSCSIHTLKPESCTHKWTWPTLLKNFSFCLHLLLQQTYSPDGPHYRNTPLQYLLHTSEVGEMLLWRWLEENKSCQLCSLMTVCHMNHRHPSQRALLVSRRTMKKIRSAQKHVQPTLITPITNNSMN